MTGIEAAGAFAALEIATFLAAGVAAGAIDSKGAAVVEATTGFEGVTRAGDTVTGATLLPELFVLFGGGTVPTSDAVRIPLTTSG